MLSSNNNNKYIIITKKKVVALLCVCGGQIYTGPRRNPQNVTKQTPTLVERKENAIFNSLVKQISMSSNNNIQQTFSLASPCTVDEATVSNAVFKTGNRFFVNVNNKFLGTFDDERSAKAKALSYSEERCLSIKRAVLQY